MRYSAVSVPYLSTTILLCFITEEKPKINCQVVIEQLPASCGDASLPSNQPTYAIGTIIVPTDTSWQQLEESLTLARQNLEDLNIRAPIAGKLSGFNIEVGF